MFYILLGKSFTDIRDSQTNYRDFCVLNGGISEWKNCFKDGRETIEKHTSRPVTAINEKKMAEFQKYILEDGRVTVENVTKHFGIPYGTALISLEGAVFSVRWVPRLLLPDQIGQRVKRSRKYSQRYNDDSEVFLNRVVTSDVT